MALIFVVKADGSQSALMVHTGDKVELGADAEFVAVEFKPTSAILEELETEALMKLAARGGQVITNAMSTRPNKKLLIGLLIEHWGSVMTSAGDGEDKKDEKGKKDKNEPLWKLSKIALIQEAGKYKIVELPDKNGKVVPINVNHTMDAIIKAIRRIEPLQATKVKAAAAPASSMAVDEATPAAAPARSMAVDEATPALEEEEESADEEFSIKIALPDGGVIKLDIEATDTIAELKAQIEEKEKIPAEKQSLTFASKKLDDRMTVADYGIVVNSTLKLTKL